MEVLVGATLGGVILVGTLSSFLFLGRSAANLVSYSDMESQARRGLEVFAQDVRQASAIAWTSDTEVTLTVNTVAVAYAYDAVTGTFSRVAAGNSRVIISGITPGTFRFRAYNVAGAELPLRRPPTLSRRGRARSSCRSRSRRPAPTGRSSRPPTRCSRRASSCATRS